jgi:pseudo-rSAM protein
MGKKSYWFYLEPYVYSVVKGENAFLYNTHNGKAILSRNQPMISRLLRRLKSEKNLYVVKLAERELAVPAIVRFVHKIRTYYMGDLINTALSDGKPFLMMPVLDIEGDVESFKRDAPEMVGRDIMIYLNELSLYINNVCGHNCPVCRDAYRQFLSCFSDSRRSSELEIGVIDELLEEVRGSRLFAINILGGDIFKYSDFGRLISLLERSPALKSFYVHYRNLVNHGEYLRLIANLNGELNVLAHFPLDRDVWAEQADLMNKHEIRANYIFVVQREEEVALAEDIVATFKIEEPLLQPFFNGRNKTFFRKHVFINRAMILEARPSLKEIFSRMALNPQQFGKLTVLSNGDIYADINAFRLGKLGRDSLYDALYKEMYHGRSWRRLRTRVLPCRHCVYDVLCPPLSSYEYALGQNNLCHVWK